MGFFNSIWTVLSLSCDRATYYLSKAQEAPLTRTERCALRLHLCLCRGCRRYQRQLLFLSELIRTTAKKSRGGQGLSQTMSPEQAQRVVRNIASNLPETP